MAAPGARHEVHSRVLAARRETFGSYRCEVHLQARIPVEEWTAVLTGRLDGCVERAAGSLADRGVQVHRPLRRTASGPRDTPSSGTGGSCSAYCYLWRRLGHPRVSGALVYVDIGTGEEVSLAVSYDDEQCDRDVERRLAQLLRIWKAQAAARARKAQAAERLPFPHTAPRPIQEKLIEAVDQAVRGREPARGGADGVRQDGRRPPPRAAPRA